MKFKMDLIEVETGWMIRNAQLHHDWQAWFENKEDAMAFMVALAKETFPE
jgi:hypothetical protein